LRRAFQNRYAHRRNQPDAQERQLEAGSEQHLRIHNHETERGRTNSIEHRFLAIKQPRPEVQSEHQRRSPDGRAQRGQQGIRHHERDGDRSREKVVDPQPPQKPERNQRENAHVHPRDHQYVVGARALEVRADGAVDECVFTNHHGVHQRGLARRPQGVDFVDDAAMDSRPPEFGPAADKAGKNLNACSLGRGQSDDPVFQKVAAVIKRARVAIVARRRNLGRKPQPLPVGEHSDGRSACFPIQLALQLLLVDINAQAGTVRKSLVASGDLFGLDLDPLPEAAGTVLL
jgi:hypothetical protein